MPLIAFHVADDSPADPNILIPIAPGRTAPLFRNNALDPRTLEAFFQICLANSGVATAAYFTPVELQQSFDDVQAQQTDATIELTGIAIRKRELKQAIDAALLSGADPSAMRRELNSLPQKERQLKDTLRSLKHQLYKINQAIKYPARYTILKEYRIDPVNKLRVVLTPRRLGWWLQLKDTAQRVEPSPEQKLEVFSAFLDSVDEAMQKVVYRFVDGQNQPLLPPLVRLEVRQMEYIGRDLHGHNKDVREPLQLRVAEEIFDGEAGCQVNSLLIVDNRDDLLTRLIPDYRNRTSDYALWIPQTFPVLFRTSDDAQVRYFADAAGIKQTDVATASSVAIYRFDGDRFESTEARGEPVTFGAGGGAMRSDRVSEVEYIWSGSSPALGYALGLDLQRYKSQQSLDEAALSREGFIRVALPAAPAGVSSPVVGDMASEIVYYKKFKPLDPRKTLPPQKKNTPRDTLPLHFSETRKRKIFSEEQLKSGQVLKKKGAWFYGASARRGGEPLKKGNTDRSSAGKVMREAFQAIGLSAETKDEDLGSATQFANYVIQRDAVAKKAWGILSAGVKVHPEVTLSESELAQRKAQIRTDQEWCHLYGHGDGGSEEVGNFISGSKHCNTVQLAIECGQRSRVDDDDQTFSIKVSGYLFPGSGWKKFAFTANDIAYLKQFRWPDVVVSGAPDFDSQQLKSALDQLLEKWPSIDFVTRLPDAPRGDHSVPTAAEFSGLSAHYRERVKNNTRERLLSIQREYLPLGALVRYKIYMNQSKIFDFSYSAQQESFDYNEFKILEYTVRRVVAVAQGRRDDYVRSINRKVEMRLAQEEQADQIRQRLGVYALV